MKRQILAFAFIFGVLGYLFFALDKNVAEPVEPIKRKAFDGWKKPVAALYLTGRQNGYIEPCGCTGLATQKGGLARRHSLLKRFLNKNWDIAPIDVGNQVRRTGEQPYLKFEATLQALRVMNYQAVGLGPDDLNLSTTQLIQNIVSNADESEKSDLFISANVDVLEFVRTYRVLKVGNKRIGITTVLGSQHIQPANVRDETIKLTKPEQALAKVAPQLVEEKCDYYVLLAFASIDECEQLARKFDIFDVVVTGGGFGEPKYMPDQIEGSRSLLIQTGNKGMYTGIIGFFDDPKEPIKYQKLVLDKRFKDSPQMLEILKEYQHNLKRTITTQGLAGLGIRPVAHPSGNEFVGSETCSDCHTQAYEKWMETPHHHATESIVHPPERGEIQRHYDPECISCHVTGWNPQQYYPYKTGYVDLQNSKLMVGNGCENCHGPGSEHVKAENGEGDFTDAQISALQASMRVTKQASEQACMECHDLDNSPDFHKDGAFDEYWKKIEHPGKD